MKRDICFVYERRLGIMESWYLLVGQHGYIAVFLYLSLGIIGLPIPVPDEIVLTYAGYLTSIGSMSFSFTFIAAFIGATCGISFSYLLGSKLGEPVLVKYGPRFFIREKTIQKTKKLFNKYGAIILILSYFIPGVRHIAAYFAGITKFSVKRFVFLTYCGAMLWASVFLLIGNRLGNNWTMISRYIHKYIWILVVLLVVVAALLSVYYVIRKRRRLPY